MVTPDGEVTWINTLSLADTNKTVPRLRLMSESAAAEVALASPSMTSRMLALPTGASVYCFMEAGTWRKGQT